MSLDSKPSLCFLCNKDLFNELLLKCYFSEFPRDRSAQSLEGLPSKKAHFLCSLFFSELELVIQNREAFLKGGQRIKSGHYLEECQICSLDAMGACLMKCAFEKCNSYFHIHCLLPNEAKFLRVERESGCFGFVYYCRAHQPPSSPALCPSQEIISEAKTYQRDHIDILSIRKSNSDWIAADFFDFGQEEETKEPPKKNNKPATEFIYNDYQIKKRKETQINTEAEPFIKPDTPLKRAKKAKLTFSPTVSLEKKKKKTPSKEMRLVKPPQRKEQSSKEKEKRKKERSDLQLVYPNFIDDSREFVMKQWWSDVNQVYFRKPVKEELELIDATHIIKLLNFMDSDEKRLPKDAAENCPFLGSKPKQESELFTDLNRLDPGYTFVDYLDDVKHLKHSARKRVDMMCRIEEDLKARHALHSRRKESRVLRNVIKWTSVLRLFCSGFRDKELDLKNYINHITVKNFSSKKDKNSTPGSLAIPNETDCCICFSSYTNEINPVVYCSGCSISFHQYCYGIDQIPSDDYFCDVCIDHRLGLGNGRKQNESPRVCAICKLGNAPLKKVENEWFHATCLFANAWGCLKNGKITLTSDFSLDKINEIVLTHELTNKACPYCEKMEEPGYQLSCSQKDCAMTSHLLCAYLNGIYFTSETKEDPNQKEGFPKLSLEIYCSQHAPVERDQKKQKTIRRYAINYHNITARKDISREFLEAVVKNQEEELKKRNHYSDEENALPKRKKTKLDY